MPCRFDPTFHRQTSWSAIGLGGRDEQRRSDVGAQHLHSRRLAVLLSVALLIFFVVLYCALEALMRWLGL